MGDSSVTISTYHEDRHSIVTLRTPDFGRIGLLALTALFLLAACTNDDGEATRTATTVAPTPAPTLTATPGITPTPTAITSVTPTPPTPTTTLAAAAESTPTPSVTVAPATSSTITTTPPPSPTPTPSPPPSPTPTAAPVPTPSPTPTLGPEIEAAATIASCDFFLEVADTAEERAQGLMGRESLGEDRGMLFVFQREQTLSFWMRNTLIPLDILFVDENLNVIDVQTMRPEHEAEGDSLPIYTSAGPAMYAIEVNEGVAYRCGIKPGAPVMLREINLDDGQ